MAMLLISTRDTDLWVRALKDENPELDLRIYPKDKNPEEIEFALVWNHPRGVFKNYPNLKVIASMGAGVDHILSDPDLPENVKITRIVDEQLAIDMAQFVLSLVMDHLRNLSFYKSLEPEQLWKPKPYLRISEVNIGIMGMGILGTCVAEKLLENGFGVSGWAKTPKSNKKMQIFTEKEEFDLFLKTSNILICLLPLTPSTENILNKEVFEKLPQNAFIINVARGKHLVEEDLLEMINSGHLSGAALDVFRTEPLPKDHPFWEHPKINVTPHIASVTIPVSVVSQILDNFERMKTGKKLKNLVELKKGY